MRDRGLIFIGLAVFAGLFTFPFWIGLGKGEHRAFSVPLPASEKECVAPVAFMRSSHMDLLDEWRDRAVRQDRRSYIGSNGKVYAVSLTGTCLQQCHGDKAAFCDRCHAYNGVQDLNCWNCHLVAQPARDGTAGGPNVRR